MSVTEYNYDSFFGLRAMRNAGRKTRCRYFSFMVPAKGGGKRRATETEKSSIRKEADNYDRILENWQRKSQAAFRRQALPTARNTTTRVRGIRFGMIIQHKRGKRYEWPGFIVSIKDAAGKPFTQGFVLRAHGFDGAWARAVKTLVKQKRWPSTSIPVLLARKPDPSRLGLNGELLL